MDTPRRRSLIEKILHHNSRPSYSHSHLNTETHAAPDHETTSTTGLIETPQPSTKTITLPLTGTETLIIPNDTPSRLPGDSSTWKYQRGARKASVAAADTGENAVAVSDVEKAQYVNLLQQTKGMNAEQIREFLAKRGSVDGGKVMRRWEEGKTGEGYMQVAGPDSGAM
jgi:hypothetical protein